MCLCTGRLQFPVFHHLESGWYKHRLYVILSTSCSTGPILQLMLPPRQLNKLWIFHAVHEMWKQDKSIWCNSSQLCKKKKKKEDTNRPCNKSAIFYFENLRVQSKNLCFRQEKHSLTFILLSQGVNTCFLKQHTVWRRERKS